MAQETGKTVTIVDGVYLLKRKLGSGGMATVFLASVDQARFDYTTLYAYTQVQADTHVERLRKARDLAGKLKGRNLDPATIRSVLEAQGIPLPGKEVALKVGKGAGNLERFESEWTNLLCLNHEHVVKVYGGGVYCRRPYYALELLPDIVPPERILEEFSLLGKIDVALQAGAGLAYLHGKGIVHRDMKPDNAITVRLPDGSCRTVVTDLGLAKNMGEDLGMTNTTTVLGTPYFMSPEQMRSAKDVDHRSDIYSLGATLYELVTRRKPYHDKTSVMEILQVAALGERPIPPERHAEHLPAHLAEIIKTAMGFGVEERYQSMDEFLADLSAFRESQKEGLSRSLHFDSFQPVEARSAGQDWRYRKYQGQTEASTILTGAGPGRGRRGRRLMFAAAGAAVLAVAAVAAWTCRDRLRPAPAPGREAAGQARTLAASPITDPAFLAAGRRQQEAARALGLPRDLVVDLAAGARLELVLVPAGEFTMGEGAGQRKVRLTRPFYLGKTELTQAQWAAVTGKRPARFQDGPDAGQRPVEQVSWGDAVDWFLPGLNAQHGPKLPPALQGWTFRLPTEAQWEQACRADSPAAYAFGDGITAGQANYDAEQDTPPGANRRQTVVAGGFGPNAWGLHDMHGNVWEWCADWQGEPAAGEAVDPAGPPAGALRVCRGGSWFNDARGCRSASRCGYAPDERRSNIGLRVLLGP